MSDAVRDSTNRVANPYWSEKIIAGQLNQGSTRSTVRVKAASRLEIGVIEDFYFEAISKQISEQEQNTSWILTAEPKLSCKGFHYEAIAISKWHNVFSFIDSANSCNSAPSFASYVIGNELEDLFRFFADRWYKAIKFVSSTTRMTTDPNYFKIIGLGKSVVPLILRELEHTPAPWFVALRVLTGNTEVGREHRGNFEKIAESWIAWGRRNALI